MTAKPLQGKIAFVTGSTGIAEATVGRFLADGAQVLVMGIDEKANTALLEKHRAFTPNSLGIHKGDVTRTDDIENALATAREWGGLDIIVNAAAIHPYGDALETSAETFAQCMAVNVGGIHLTAKAGIPLMRQRGGGAILNLSSVQGHACQKGVAAYVASKGAIHALTRSLAVDFAADQIRVNSISPGSVRTPLLKLAVHRFDGPDADVEAAFARFGAAHPLGRIGEAEEVADLIAFLASDRARFITGADHRIDGGLTAGLGVS